MKQKLFALMSVAALLASCSNDDFLTQAPSEAPKSAGIVFKLADEAATRGEFTADEAGNFATSWNAEVDRIGIIYSGVAKNGGSVDATIWNDVSAADRTSASVGATEIGMTNFATYKTTRSGSYGWVTAVDDANILTFAPEVTPPASQTKGSFRAIRPVSASTSVTYKTNAQKVPSMDVAITNFTTQDQKTLKAEFGNFFMVADPLDNVYSATNAVGEELSLAFERPYAALAVRTVGYDKNVYGKLLSVTVAATQSNLSSTNSTVDVAKKVNGAWVVTPGAGVSTSVTLQLNSGAGLDWSDDAYAFIQVLPVDRSEMPVAEAYTVTLTFDNGAIKFNKSTSNNWAANSFVRITCDLDDKDYLYLSTNTTLIVNKALPTLNGANQFDGVGASSVTNFISKISLSAAQLSVVKNKFTGVTSMTLANQSADLGDNLANVYAGSALADLTLTAATVAPKLTGTGASAALATLDCPAVTSVPAYAYQNNTVLSDVKFPVVETIGNYAFSGATQLTTIGCATADALEIGYTTVSPAAKHSSLTTVGSFAFDGISMTTVDAPEVTTMGARAFGNAAINSLTSVLLPKYDFSDTYNVIALLNGNTLTTADLSAVEELGVTTIAFNSSATLTTVTLKPGVKIGLSAFASCTALTTINNLYQAAEIGENAFMGCTALANAKVNAATIGVNAFKGCTGLTNVVIGSGVTTISEGAFSGCSALTTVSNLANVSSIGKEAFMGTGIPAFDFTSAELGEGAFKNCSGLKGTVRSNVTVLEKDVFNGANKADRFVFPNVTTVKSGALKGVTASTLATVTFGQALTSIAGDAFSTVAATPGTNDGSSASKPILGTAGFNLILANKTGLTVNGANVTFKGADDKWYKITFQSVQ